MSANEQRQQAAEKRDISEAHQRKGFAPSTRAKPRCSKGGLGRQTSDASLTSWDHYSENTPKKAEEVEKAWSPSLRKSNPLLESDLCNKRVWLRPLLHSITTCIAWYLN
jgi:hypothetical protein